MRKGKYTTATTVLDIFLWTKVKFPAFQLSLLSQIPNKVAFLLGVSEFFPSLHTLWLSRSTSFMPSTAPISGSSSLWPPGHQVPCCQQEAGEQSPSWEPAQSQGHLSPFLRSAISLSLSFNWTSVLQLYGPASPLFLLIFTVPIKVTNSSIPYFCTAEDEMEF